MCVGRQVGYSHRVRDVIRSVVQKELDYVGESIAAAKVVNASKCKTTNEDDRTSPVHPMQSQVRRLLSFIMPDRTRQLQASSTTTP